MGVRLLNQFFNTTTQLRIHFVWEMVLHKVDVLLQQSNGTVTGTKCLLSNAHISENREKKPKFLRPIRWRSR